MQISSPPFSFFVSSDVRFGPGEARQLPTVLVPRNWRRLGLVVDAGVARTPAWKAVEESLTAGGCSIAARLECTVAEPTYDYLEESRQVLQKDPLDAVVVAGGGSTLDLGKALSVLITNPGHALEYRGFDLIKNPGPPVIAIPTTAGTGSEVTPNAVFTNAAEKRKLGINTRMYVPKLVVLDPELSVTCPRGSTLASGLDALVQSIENYTSLKATALSKPFSREAIAMAFEALPRVIEHPESVDARGAMQLAAFVSGIGLMNGGGGIAGALSYPLGTHFKVPHGLAHAVFTPAVVRWNVERGSEAYVPLHDAVRPDQAHRPAAEKGRAFDEALRALFVRVGGPLTLADVGLSAADVGAFKHILSTATLHAALDQNPAPFSPTDIPAFIDSLAG